jgi:signal transduction histidine kinase
MKANEAHQPIMLSQQLACSFESFPDGAIACDGEGQIVQINTAARKLFEVASLGLYRGISYHQFLQPYQPGDQQQRVISLEPWLMSLLIDDEATSSRQEAPMVLQVPSGRKVYVTIRCSPVLDAQQHPIGTVSVFHNLTGRYQKALHLQRVHDAVATLQEAIAHVPEHLDLTFPEGTIFLLSPPVLFVAQQLVDVIRQVLDCQHVGLLAFGPAGHLHYAVGGGFTQEQEQFVQERIGRFLPSDLLDETALARLDAGQEVMLSTDRMRLPPEIEAAFGAANFLLVPLFLEQQSVGALFIAKAGVDSGYAPEEIELVKAVATQAALVIECILCLYEQAETWARALAQQEMQRLTNDFLNLASHELNTPLTVIKGNLQLAQRRLATLKRQITEQLEQLSEQIELPLASATQRARLQERMIEQLITDARLQANTLDLHMQRCDLSLLFKEAVAAQQRLAPEHTIMLENMAPEQVVPIIAEPERITQVITTYLEHALSYAPADQPVTVQLRVEGAVARVSVHDEGPALPAEEQGHIWGRHFYAKEATAQDELDLSLGLSFYLCQAFIERHHGTVGVQSEPGHGVTFWFTLPIAASPGA